MDAATWTQGFKEQLAMGIAKIVFAREAAQAPNINFRPASRPEARRPIASRVRRFSAREGRSVSDIARTFNVHCGGDLTIICTSALKKSPDVKSSASRDHEIESTGKEPFRRIRFPSAFHETIGRRKRSSNRCELNSTMVKNSSTSKLPVPKSASSAATEAN